MDEIRTFVVGALETNCLAYVSQGEAMVVDPGAHGAWIAERLSDVSVRLIVATHRHHDHVGGVAALAGATGAPWAISAGDAEGAIRALELSGHVTPGLIEADELADPPSPDRLLSAGDALSVGTATFEVVEAPGHTPGGIVLVGGGTAAGVALMGDTLFAGSCGRTDLAGGDPHAMALTLGMLARTIPPGTRLLCGHGPETTMAHELRTNPYLLGLG